jgi:hypothetical protein
MRRGVERNPVAEHAQKTAPAPQELTTVQAIQALAEAMRPQGPLEMAGFTPERVKELTQLPAPQKYRDIPWKSEETGATAIAHVIESRKFPNGRVVQLINYTHPKEAYVYEEQGGKVPQGFPMWAGNHPTNLPEGEEPAQGTFNNHFLQWRWVTFFQADIRRYVGREIQPHHCQSPDGLKTPWIEGRVGSITE